MKKVFVVVICVMMAFCLVSAAIGSSLEDAVKSVVVDKNEVNISFWTGTGANNFPYLEAIVNNFQEAYPNIHVDFQNQGAINDLMTKLTQNIVARQTPTLSNVNPTYFREFIDSGAVGIAKNEHTVAIVIPVTADLIQIGLRHEGSLSELPAVLLFKILNPAL